MPGIMVEATQLGFYNSRRRRPGDVFEIRDNQAFSRKWMRPAPKNSSPTHQDFTEEELEAARKTDKQAAADLGMPIPGREPETLAEAQGSGVEPNPDLADPPTEDQVI
jgi:hypothetical protein